MSMKNVDTKAAQDALINTAAATRARAERVAEKLKQAGLDSASVEIGHAAVQQAILDKQLKLLEEQNQLQGVLGLTPEPEPTPEPVPVPVQPAPTPEPVAKPTILGGFGNEVFDPGPAPRAVRYPRDNPFDPFLWGTLQWIFAVIGALIVMVIGWYLRGWVALDDMPGLLVIALQSTRVIATTSLGFFGGGWVGAKIDEWR